LDSNLENLDTLSNNPVVKSSGLGDISAELEQLLEDHGEATNHALESLIGSELSTVFSVLEKGYLENGFGGLLVVPRDVAQHVSLAWTRLLQAMKERGEYKGSVEGNAFICRMMPDGSLFLKAVPMPEGLVFCSTSFAPPVQQSGGSPKLPSQSGPVSQNFRFDGNENLENVEPLQTNLVPLPSQENSQDKKAASASGVKRRSIILSNNGDVVVD